MLGARPEAEHGSRVPAADRWKRVHKRSGFSTQPSLHALARGKRQTVREVLEHQEDVRKAKEILAQAESKPVPEPAPARPQSAAARPKDLEGFDAAAVFARPKSAGMLRQESKYLRASGSAPALAPSETPPPPKPPRKKDAKPLLLPGSQEARAVERATIPQFPGSLINSSGPDRIPAAILKDVVNQSYFGTT
jgi:hypothetical protein